MSQRGLFGELVDRRFPRQREGDLGAVREAAPPRRVDLPGGRRAQSRRAKAAHLALMLLAGVATGLLTGLQPLGIGLVVLVVLLARLQGVLDGPRPEFSRPGAVINHGALSLAAVALATAAGILPVSANVPSALTVAAALLTDACATFVRRFLPSATRIVLVGGVDSLAVALTRWSDLRDVEVVGALEVVQEPQTALPDLQVSLGLTEDSPAVAQIEGLREVPQWAESWDADTVVVLPGTGVSADSLRLLGWHLERTPTTLAVAGVFDPVAPHRITTTRVGTTTLLVARPSRPRLPHRVTKWVFDRAAGLFLLVLALPLLAVLCLMIRLDSSGPSLFRQVRVGRGGRPFTMVKLRTMHTDAEARKATLAGADEGNGVLFKIRRDPRVTSVGRFLRKSSLDELPQLVNVVLGHMSLVGPRPALPDEVAGYDEHEHRRYAVRPGMTGLWQVSGRSDLSWEESMELDLQYVDNHATGADATILFRTFWAVVRSKGAY